MQRRLLSVSEVCEELNVARSTLYVLVRSGKLRPVKIGKSTRFRVEEIDGFVEGLTPATPERVRRVKLAAASRSEART